jgi:hypothetical protein
MESSNSTLPEQWKQESLTYALTSSLKCKSMDNNLMWTVGMGVLEQYSYLCNGKWNPQTLHYLNSETVNSWTTVQEWWKCKTLNNTTGKMDMWILAQHYRNDENVKPWTTLQEKWICESLEWHYRNNGIVNIWTVQVFSQLWCARP